MKGYVEGYMEGVREAKLTFLDIIEEHRSEDPRAVLLAIETVCKKEINIQKDDETRFGKLQPRESAVCP